MSKTLTEDKSLQISPHRFRVNENVRKWKNAEGVDKTDEREIVGRDKSSMCPMFSRVFTKNGTNFYALLLGGAS